MIEFYNDVKNTIDKNDSTIFYKCSIKIKNNNIVNEKDIEKVNIVVNPGVSINQEIIYDMSYIKLVKK